ncbi:MAE_28990/MAE_18760 family HEPN-like nuclease [Streptomyces sp. NPDC003717]|uniref:MAE_28990/MAE_18760 family HEPN-like nuclease n=1 Tax=Streptomyces sp. NPDC003717 TaxID=3154276 RepID=UPI0033A8DA7C
MNVAELRAQLEEDLAWRLDELRHLRNRLLGDEIESEWSVSSMRAILVMQYAHLEGFTRNAFALYVSAINSRKMTAGQLKPQLLAAALGVEFDALRKNKGEHDDEDEEEGKLTRRARNHVSFLQRLQELTAGHLEISSDTAISMEMNMGRDVLRRCLYMLAIPIDEVSRAQYSSIEFVKNARNDVAHGSRKERISSGMFKSHAIKCEQFMKDLTRIITSAMSRQLFLAESDATAPK